MPVVDASVVVDWVAPDSDPGSRARRLLTDWADADAHVLAPRLLHEEVANALLAGVRRDRWSGAQADAAFATLLRLPVQVRDTPADVTRAYELSRRYDEHPFYDMIYVAMTERLGEQLFTADHRLVERTLLPYVTALS